jgi:hypothetical protein
MSAQASEANGTHLLPCPVSLPGINGHDTEFLARPRQSTFQASPHL